MFRAQVLIVRRPKLYYTVSGIITPIGVMIPETVDRAPQYIYLNIKQLDALNFIMSLFHASTCFEHMCSLSGGQNCTTQPLVSSHL